MGLRIASWFLGGQPLSNTFRDPFPITGEMPDMPRARQTEWFKQGVHRMGRGRSESTLTRRALIAAPIGIVIAIAGRMITGSFGSALHVATGGLLGETTPSPSAGSAIVTWAPGPRLVAGISDQFYAVPSVSGSPRIRVRTVIPPDGSDRASWLERLTASGQLPDVVSSVSSSDLRRIRIATRITDLVRRDQLQIDQFDAAAFRAAEAGGDIWALPYAWDGQEIGIALDRTRFQQAGLGSADSPAANLPISDVSRQMNGWSWTQFADAMEEAGSLVLKSGATPLERFGTIRSLPAMWGASWASEDGRTAVDKLELLVEAFGKYDELRTRVGQKPTRGQDPIQGKIAPPAPTPPSQGRPAAKGAPTATPVVTPVPLRGPSSVGMGIGGPSLLRVGRAAASSIDLDHVSDLQSALLMPLPRGTVSTADVEIFLLTVSPSATYREQAWTLVKWLTDAGRLANAERLVPAWRSAQGDAIRALGQVVLGGGSGTPPDRIQAIFEQPPIVVSLPREPSPRDASRALPSTPTTTRSPAQWEYLISQAIRRAPPRDPLLDGPAGRQAKLIIATGLQAWENGVTSPAEAIAALVPELQGLINTTPSVLPA